MSNIKFFLHSCVIIIFLSGVFVFSAQAVSAGDSIMESVSENCRDRGDCELNEFVGLLEKYYDIFLGISGALALLFFVIGGLMFLLSAGNKTWVDRGKATLIGATIGLIVVFLSYTIIQFVFDNIVSSGYRDNPFTSGMESDRQLNQDVGEVDYEPGPSQ